MYLLHQLLSEALPVLGPIGSHPRPCLVHPWFHGFPDEGNLVGAENRWRITAWRDAASECIGCSFTTSVEQELEALQRYHDGRLNHLRSYRYGWGLLVEQADIVKRSLDRLRAEVEELQWIVLATEHNGLEPSGHLSWQEALRRIARLELRCFEVFGCNNGAPETCVPSVTRFLKESGHFSEVQIVADASFDWQGHAR